MGPSVPDLSQVMGGSPVGVPTSPDLYEVMVIHDSDWMKPGDFNLKSGKTGTPHVALFDHELGRALMLFHAV